MTIAIDCHRLILIITMQFLYEVLWFSDLSKTQEDYYDRFNNFTSYKYRIFILNV